MNSYRLIETAWTLTLVAILVVVAYALTGCGPVRCDRPVVTLQRPTLPTVPADRLQCLDDRTYLDLVDRELRLREYAEQCEAIVQEVTQ